MRGTFKAFAEGLGFALLLAQGGDQHHAAQAAGDGEAEQEEEKGDEPVGRKRPPECLPLPVSG